MLDFTVSKYLNSCGVLWTAVNGYSYILSGHFYPMLNTRGLRHSQFETTTAWTKVRGVSASSPGRHLCVIMALGETLEKEVLVIVKPSVSRWGHQENLERPRLSGNEVQRWCREFQDSERKGSLQKIVNWWNEEQQIPEASLETHQVRGEKNVHAGA